MVLIDQYPSWDVVILKQPAVNTQLGRPSEILHCREDIRGFFVRVVM